MTKFDLDPKRYLKCIVASSFQALFKTCRIIHFHVEKKSLPSTPFRSEQLSFVCSNMIYYNTRSLARKKVPAARGAAAHTGPGLKKTFKTSIGALF